MNSTETKRIKITEASKMEQAKALKAFSAVLDSEEDYSHLKTMITSSVSEPELGRAIRGLAEEDEFLLMCSLMETATHFIRLEQSPIIRGDSIVPDFLAKFRPGCYINRAVSSESNGFKCLIDVKSTSANEFTIGGSLLKRRRQFADEFGLPLLFAVRLLQFTQNALWLIVEDTNRNSTTLKVTIEDMVDGVRHVLWDEYHCLLLPGTYFVVTYDSKSKAEGLYHKDYGVQREFRIIHKDQVIPVPDNESVLYAALFESFDLTEAKVERKGSRTLQALVPGTISCSIVDLVYKFNRLPTDDNGRVIYNPSRIIARSDGKTDSILVTRSFIEKLIQPLFQAKIFGLVGIGEEEEHIRKWRRFGGQK
jgi:hypothetical protein